MKTRVCELLGIDKPIFGFSHCRDVVAAVSRAGGCGVLGVNRFTPEQLDRELSILDEQLQGFVYGIDAIVPASDTGQTIQSLRNAVPPEHKAFVNSLVERFQIPPPKQPEQHSPVGSPEKHTAARSRELLEVGLDHGAKLVASGLGPFPTDVIDKIKESGRTSAGLVGSPKHAVRHQQGGTDIVVAIGTEGAGHTGDIGTMVLVPDVVDAVHPLPVLAGGGIGTGRQMAACLALGADGVWMGSVWLTTLESDLDPIVQERLLSAASEDTVRSRCRSGKPNRQLRTAWVKAWEEPNAPDPLPMPLQLLLTSDVVTAIEDYRIPDLMGTPIGQIVSRMQRRQSVGTIIQDMILEFAETVEYLSGKLESQS